MRSPCRERAQLEALEPRRLLAADVLGYHGGDLTSIGVNANETILTWDRVGYFDSHDDKLNSFQLVIRGPGFNVPTGEGTIGFFYKGMPWEVTDTSQTAAVVLVKPAKARSAVTDSGCGKAFSGFDTIGAMVPS